MKNERLCRVITWLILVPAIAGGMVYLMYKLLEVCLK
jgi:hypothetical protein